MTIWVLARETIQRPTQSTMALMRIKLCSSHASMWRTRPEPYDPNLIKMIQTATIAAHAE